MWTIFYYTAWAPATPFYRHVSKQYPNVVFRQEVADEGGYYVGFIVIQNGEISQEVMMDWEADDGKALRLNYDDDESD